jgi:hypothetical protein
MEALRGWKVQAKAALLAAGACVMWQNMVPEISHPEVPDEDQWYEQPAKRRAPSAMESLKERVAKLYWLRLQNAKQRLMAAVRDAEEEDRKMMVNALADVMHRLSDTIEKKKRTHQEAAD